MTPSEEGAVFLACCAFFAAATLGAGEVRIERERSARYAKVIAGAMNGDTITAPGTFVLCYPTEVSSGLRTVPR